MTTQRVATVWSWRVGLGSSGLEFRGRRDALVGDRDRDVASRVRRRSGCESLSRPLHLVFQSQPRCFHPRDLGSCGRFLGGFALPSRDGEDGVWFREPNQTSGYSRPRQSRLFRS